jgi:hypothetical protein
MIKPADTGPFQRGDMTYLHEKLGQAIYDSIAHEMELSKPFDPMVHLSGSSSAEYEFRRSLVESVGGGCHAFVSKGRLTKVSLPTGQEVLQDVRSSEGWVHEPTH